MTLVTFLTYLLALFLASATPGPAMLAVISTGIGRGVAPALACGLGIALSDLLLVSVVLAGLAVIAQTFGWIFFVIKYAGAAYLIYLGYRMWRAASHVQADVSRESGGCGRSLLLGAAIAFGNPKAILFHASLMPLILDIGSLDASGVIIVLAAVFGVNIVTMGSYAVLAGMSSRWLRTPRAVRAVNRLGGSAMIGTGVLIATKS